MPAKKDNLPLVNEEAKGNDAISYATEVIATIAGVAASEVEGIAGMCNVGSFGDILSRNKNITKGVKVDVSAEEASVDLYVTIEYGTPIQQAARDAQENVRKAIETMTGLKVVKVDVHVQGVSFEKENSQQAVLTEAPKAEKLKAPEAKPAEAKAPANEKVELVEEDEDEPAAQDEPASQAETESSKE